MRLGLILLGIFFLVYFAWFIMLGLFCLSYFLKTDRAKFDANLLKEFFFNEYVSVSYKVVKNTLVYFTN